MLENLTIGVSCFDTTLARVIAQLATLPPEISRLVAVQHHPQNPLSDTELNQLLNQADVKDIEVLLLDSIGLTKSRNAIIGACKTSYLLLSDDDQGYDIEGIWSGVRRLHGQPRLAVVTGQIETPEGEPRIPYPKEEQVHTWRSQLTVGSIEMMLNIKHPIFKRLRFRENFGLGTALPASEECLFLNDIRTANAKALYLPIPFAIHPKDSSGENLSAERIKARGASFNIMFSYWGLLLLIPYALRQKRFFKDNLTLIQFIKFFLDGFFSKK